MLTLSKLWLVFAIYPPVTVALTSNSRTYKESDEPNQLTFDCAVLESASVRSALDCAVLCSGTPECWGFKFHNGNTTCYIRHSVTEELTGLTDFTSFTIIGKSKCSNQYIWNKELDFCYKIHDKDKKLWDDAEKICQAETEGGRLVVLDSAAKHDALLASVRENPPLENYYVGARRYLLSERFQWTDGQLVDKVPWCTGQPKDEKCGSLWADEGLCMDDNDCSDKQRFVCEKHLGK